MSLAERLQLLFELLQIGAADDLICWRIEERGVLDVRLFLQDLPIFGRRTHEQNLCRLRLRTPRWQKTRVSLVNLLQANGGPADNILPRVGNQHKVIGPIAKRALGLTAPRRWLKLEVCHPF